MTNEYVLYQKFTDLDSAEEFAEELKINGITCHFENNNHSYLTVVGYNSIDFSIGVNIKQSDFRKADLILEKYYESQIKNIDKDYYLYDYTTEELQDIISSPYDWGRLDFQLAKHLLKEKGIQINEDYINERKEEKVSKLSEIKPVSKVKLICCYMLCFFMPPFSMLNGFLIVNSGNILPNGQKVFGHSESDRKHGRRIIGLSIVMTVIIIIEAIREKF